MSVAQQSKVVIAIALAGLALFACSKKKADTSAAPGTFGAVCTVDTDCGSGACFHDQQQAAFCSIRCSDDSQCGAPSSGKCNRKGFCKR